MGNKKKRALEDIRAIILDVDGVLTDGRITLGSGDIELKSFHVQDGMAINIARRCGIKIGFVTERTSEAVEKRARELKVDYLFQGVKDKSLKLMKISESEKIPLKKFCYVGDDITDIPALQLVGFPATVADAPKEVRSCVSYVSKKCGGQGAVRDIIQHILTCQGKWKKTISSMIKHKNPTI
jgi:3-deoxy-D-manno-octulosonate 8-phosphate phosphatase (KDO 8-P phosphatase)